MRNQLYFICPTDYLENVIERTFQEEKYFYTSLGNSVSFDAQSVGQFSEFLEKRLIGEISFILSTDNRIILESLQKKQICRIKGLQSFHAEITKQKKQVELVWQTQDYPFLLVSYYLNSRIKALRKVLSYTASHFNITGKIYVRSKKTFKDIYFDPMCRQSIALN